MSFSVSLSSSDKALITFEPYIDGVASEVVTNIDLRSKDILEGSTSFSVLTQGVLTNDTPIEMYVYADGNDDITVKQTFQYKLMENREIMNVVRASVFENREYKIKEIKITSIKILPQCIACQTDQPGQLAHMYPGGCLYD